MRLKPSPTEWVLRSALMWVHQHKYPTSPCQGSSGTIWCQSGCFAREVREVLGVVKAKGYSSCLITQDVSVSLEKLSLWGADTLLCKGWEGILYLCTIFWTTGRIKLGKTAPLAKIIFKEINYDCAWLFCGYKWGGKAYCIFSVFFPQNQTYYTSLRYFKVMSVQIWKFRSWATLFIVNEKKL